ncbi:MAG: sensor histidine kinase KdpD [Dehalococcoidales bacterium]
MAEDYTRPNPDELLTQVKAEEEQKKRGKLKIFLGYAPGVGKTYTMLEAARLQKKDTDVVVAVVETHGRVETEALLEGLEVIPRRQAEYRGIKLTEMNLDAVLARHPQLALVDELAHENAPGSRHPKRYQDIEELLAAGINVYTTLNIQHIESGRNAVAQITGVWVRETVPDSFIDSATEIEIVDLPPEELLKRLKEGKVYLTEQIARATEEYFRKGNLMALRELAMRNAAKHVDEQTLAYMKTHAIQGPWPSGEHLLVCISPGPAGTRVVRNARRLAYQLGAEWFAIYVETPDAHLSPGQQERLTGTLRMAERMGARVATIQGNTVVSAVTEFAVKNNITKIIIGKSQKTWWRKLFGGSTVNQLIRRSEHFDVYIIGSRGEPAQPERSKAPEKGISRNWRGYLQGLGLVVLATLLGQLIHGYFAPTTIAMLYLLSVVITAYLWGLGPSIMVSVLGVVAFDFFHVPPYLTFRVTDTQYVFTFLVLLLVGVIISFLALRVRRQTESARRRERETAALYSLGRDLAVSSDLASYIRAIITRAKETFGHDTVVFLPDPQNRETLKPSTSDQNIAVDENELAAAIWAYQHQRIVGHGTDTLPNAKARYLPLVTARGAVGVMAISAIDTSSGELTIEQEYLLEAYADLAAVAIESILLANEAQNAQVLRNTEKLQTALLNAVSHDLRTPLVSIIGVLSSLQEKGMHLNDVDKMNLIQVAREEAERLNHLITNLLDVSRIEAGAIKISRQPSDVQDLVGAALEQLGNRASTRSVNMEIPADLPYVSVDFGLIVQTLVNVLDNAFKYSPDNSPIDIRARKVRQEMQIEIADRGIGIPPQDLSHIFDKFYRIQRPDNVTGTGLGLSICKGIIEAHGGRISAENRPGGGTIMRLVLPVPEPDHSKGEQSHA